MPYRGMTPVMQDLAGGHVDLVLGSVPSAMAQVESGRVRALAVTGESAAPQLPSLPTAASAGAPGFTFDAWSGVLSRAADSTPQAVN
ncbi:tripartite tricarboxylate transporter substrate-binding protein [Cupriavidus basilensis]